MGGLIYRKYYVYGQIYIFIYLLYKRKKKENGEGICIEVNYYIQ